MRNFKLVAWLVAVYFTLAVSIASTSGILNHPPEPGDGHDYDMIAVTLLKGLGFGYAWSDSEWRSPYELSGDALYEQLLTRQGDFTETAYRPPALPYALAALYRVFGREFWIWRVLNMALASVAYGIAMLLATRVAGTIGGLAVFFLALADTQYLAHANSFLTEIPASLVIMLTLFQLFNLASRNESKPKLVGSICGLGILIRNSFSLFLPGIIAAFYFQRVRQVGKSRASHESMRLCLCALLFVLPWGIRNVAVTGAFFPLGTQGGMNSVEGYSDETLAAGGLSNLHAFARVNSKAQAICAERALMGIQCEVFSAQFTQQEARRWIGENLMKIPELALLKLHSLWYRDTTLFQRWLAAFAFLGLLCATSYALRYSVLVPCVSITLGVMATWSAMNGRFLVPLHPALALGVVGIFQRLSSTGPRNRNTSES
jgi:hypothetical protein